MENTINKRHGDLEALYLGNEPGHDCGVFEIVIHVGDGRKELVATVTTDRAHVELKYLLVFSVERLPVFLVLCRYARAYLKAEEEMNKALHGPQPGEFVERN